MICCLNTLIFDFIHLRDFTERVERYSFVSTQANGALVFGVPSFDNSILPIFTLFSNLLLIALCSISCTFILFFAEFGWSISTVKISIAFRFIVCLTTIWSNSLFFIQLYDVQKCNSVKIVNSTYVFQKAKSLNYFATALK